MSNSLERRRLESVRILLRRVELHKPLGVVETQKTTIYKHDWTVCDDDALLYLQETAFYAPNELNHHRIILSWKLSKPCLCIMCTDPFNLRR